MILDCPHCGRSSDLKYGDLSGTGIDIHGWQVMCSNFGVSGPASKLPEDAVQFWNKITRAAAAMECK